LYLLPIWILGSLIIVFESDTKRLYIEHDFQVYPNESEDAEAENNADSFAFYVTGM
jgi:hypothetical protein